MQPEPLQELDPVARLGRFRVRSERAFAPGLCRLLPVPERPVLAAWLACCWRRQNDRAVWCREPCRLFVGRKHFDPGLACAIAVACSE
jgi:hypothetical protein